MPSYVAQANTGADALVSSRSVSIPVGVSAGDVGVFWLGRWESTGSFPAVTAPAGAVLRTTILNSAIQTLCYIHRITNETSFAYSWTGTRWSALGAEFFTGVDPALDLTTVPIHTLTGTGTSISTLTVTTVDTAALAWHVNTLSGGSAHTPPTNFTELADVNAWSMAYRIASGDGSQSASGAALASSTAWNAGLIALAPAASTTSASGADTGSSLESQSLLVTLPGSDTGSGAEVHSLTASQTRTDTGSGTEAHSISATQTRTDAASGSEAQLILSTLTGSDTGTASEAYNLGVHVSDVASGTEAQSISATLSQGDTGTATESFTIRVISSDSASAVESQTLTASLTGTDTNTDVVETHLMHSSLSSADHITAVEHVSITVVGDDGHLVVTFSPLFSGIYLTLEPSQYVFKMRQYTEEE